MRADWSELLAQAQAVHTGALAEFAPFPADLKPQPVQPHRIPAAALFEDSTQSHPLAQAFQNASPEAQWRETYKGSQIAGDFLDRFGCYCLIGQGGPFISREMGAYVVTMPPHLDYPWHHHPAVEAYLVLSGSAKFLRMGEDPVTLGPGDTSIHASNQPHATITEGEFLVAYVVWRGDLSVKPVWTEEALR